MMNWKILLFTIYVWQDNTPSNIFLEFQHHLNFKFSVLMLLKYICKTSENLQKDICIHPTSVLSIKKDKVLEILKLLYEIVMSDDCWERKVRNHFEASLKMKPRVIRYFILQYFRTIGKCFIWTYCNSRRWHFTCREITYTQKKAIKQKLFTWKEREWHTAQFAGFQIDSKIGVLTIHQKEYLPRLQKFCQNPHSTPFNPFMQSCLGAPTPDQMNVMLLK